MAERTYIFAGGGTGGHIYPSIAIAEQIRLTDPNAQIHFFCSERKIDTQILEKTDFKFTRLPATGFSKNPAKLMRFIVSFFNSWAIAKKIIAQNENTIVIGAGGFVAAPACLAGYKLKKTVVLINVDAAPGKANKLIARFSKKIFTQFDDTAQYFGKHKNKVTALGCPLRTSFNNPDPNKAKSELALDANKKILLITGASSGSQSINEAIFLLLERLADFANDWQIVHLTGQAGFTQAETKYANAKIEHKILKYYDDMAGLLSAADLVIARSGAVSIAEFTAASLPSICMPYPHHKDRHQYLNAANLVQTGAAIIVDDPPDVKDRAKWLWQELTNLLTNEQNLKKMKTACEHIANPNATQKIAQAIMTCS